MSYDAVPKVLVFHVDETLLDIDSLQPSSAAYSAISTCCENVSSSPSPETYRSVAESLGVELATMCMVAAHTWETLGARSDRGVPPHW